MATDSKTRKGEMLQALFRILKEETEGMTPKDALSRLAEELTPTEYEKGSYPSGGNRFTHLARFATVGAVKAGWMVKDGNRWLLTDAGKDALIKYKTPAELQKAVNKLYYSWRKGIKTH